MNSSTPRAGRRPLLAVFLAIGAGLALYLPNLRLQLVADDYIFLMLARTRALLPSLLTTGGVSYYRPLSRQVYFWVMTQLAGTSPFAFHLAGLLLYLAGVALLAAVAWRVVSPAAGALAATLYVAQHAGSGLTGWACCTQDLLALLFTLSALLLHMRGRRGFAVALFAMGLFSKETAAVTPFLVLAWERWGKERGRPDPVRIEASRTQPALADRRAPFLAAAPYLAVLAAWGIAYALWFRNFSGGLPDAPVMDVRFELSTLARGIYLGLMGLVNLEEGALALPRAAVDVARAVAGLALGIGAVGLAVRGAASVPAGADKPKNAAPQRREHGGRSAGLAMAAIWMALSLAPLALIGHRWSVYDNAMLGSGFAMLLAALLHRRPAAALACAALLLVTGPAADAYTGGPSEEALKSLWNLPRLRRLSAYTGTLRAALLRSHPRLEPGTHVLLANVPPMSGVALYQSDALRAWYADTSLVMTSLGQGYNLNSPPARLLVMDCDATTDPPGWIEEGAEWQRHIARMTLATREERMEDLARDAAELVRLPEWKLQRGPFRSRILAAQGMAARKLGDVVEAESLYAASVVADSSNSLARSWLGLLQLQLGRPQPAELNLARASRELPDDAMTAYGYGLALAQLRAPGAAEWLEKGLGLGLGEPGRTRARDLARALRGGPHNNGP